MSTMQLHKEAGSFEAYSVANAALLHRCPVCRTVHEVSAVRSKFAYGRQLACSPDCEAQRRRAIRAAYRLASALELDSGRTMVSSDAERTLPNGGKPASLKLMISDYAPSSAALKTAGAANCEGSRTMVVGELADVHSRNQSTRRLAPVGEHKAAISATVEAADVLRLRRAIFQAGGASVGILKTAPVPHSSRVRVFIGLKLGALESIMAAIMRSVTACEFGRVVRM